jgi:hypothetical protein
MDSISTEQPLDMDYFHREERMDTSTMISYLQEYNRIGGMTVNWYRLQDAEMGMDPVFLEKADKKWCRPIAIKAVFQYLEEVVENQKYGVPILDEVNLIIEKTYWTEVTKTDKPEFGDLFYIEHVGMMFEVNNRVDSDANFWGNKLTWKLTAKQWQDGHEDPRVTDDITEPGWAPDETNLPQIPIPGEPNPGTVNGDGSANGVTAGIEEKCEELHTYLPGENPFGNY